MKDHTELLYKFIFIHIPKTGGTSLREMLNMEVDYNHHRLQALIDGRDNGRGWDWDFDRLDDYFKFTIVRNPWDRFISTYFYLKEELKNRIPRLIKNNKSAEDIEIAKANIQRISTEYSKYPDISSLLEEAAKDPNKLFYISPILKPQCHWLDPRLDYVGRFENYRHNVNMIMNSLRMRDSNFSRDRHVNKSKHEHYTTYYNETTKKFIAEIYGEDIERLKYNFR